jgi:hypothetical protein
MSLIHRDKRIWPLEGGSIEVRQPGARKSLEPRRGKEILP